MAKLKIVKFEENPPANINYQEPKNKIYYEIYGENFLYRSEYLNVQGKFDSVIIPLSLFKNQKIRILFYKNVNSLINEFNMDILSMN